MVTETKNNLGSRLCMISNVLLQSKVIKAMEWVLFASTTLFLGLNSYLIRYDFNKMPCCYRNNKFFDSGMNRSKLGMNLTSSIRL